GVCQCHKQTEYPWSACQKAPSVTVTWGWGSCGLMVDLGNSAATTLLNINQNKKLEDVMANSTDNQVKSSMLGAVTQGR
ncbi:hypothetical protein, partial [Aeromonas caviae]|uniref:hypothetical protein n=1 Tax=Aeromonas caviae TaxID=648 RepID=UPI001C57126B